MSTLASPPPPAPAARPSKPASGLGIAALALGLVALVLGLIPFVGFGTWLVGLVGAVLGVVGLLQKERRRGLPAVGLAVSVVAIVVGLVVSISAVLGVATAISRSIEDSGTGRVAVGSSVAPDAATASGFRTSYGTFRTRTVTGRGDDVVTLPKGASGGLVVATYAGSGNFSVIPQGADDASTGELLVNTIGRYRGTTAWGLGGVGQATTLKVSADGRWRIVLKPMDSVKALPKKGIGDGVYEYTGGAATWAITHRGESNFVVIEYSASPVPNLAVNEIGHYRGQVPVDAGPAIVTVTADGKWTIK